MRRLRTKPMATTAAALALVLTAAACTTAEDDSAGDADSTASPSDEATSPDAAEGAPVITYGYEQEFLSYQNNTAAQNATANSIVLNQTIGGFWNYGPSGDADPNETYGTFEKVSDDPLTVDFSFAEDAVWSDGESIDCDDFKLAWIASVGLETGETDPETGNPILLFDPASTAGFENIESVECADGDKDVTVTFAEPFVDWAGLFGSTLLLPAHVVEREASIDDIIPLIDDRDLAGLTPASDFWKDGWVFNPGELPDPSLIPSSGPYVIDSWEAGQSLTLVRNENYWGEPAATETIVIRYIPQEQQAQALQNGEIQAMDPQPNPELVAQLEGLGDAVAFETADQFLWEHLDYNFETVFADRNLREAFALCVPRELIVENLIRPQNSEAEVLNTRKYLPFQEDFDQAVSEAYPGGYDEVDIERATELVEASGVDTPIPVRIGYRTPNQRRTDTVSLIRDSCNQAGFDIQDIGSEDFFGNGLANGIFDVALFGWAGSALLTGDSSTYTTNGGNNNGKYSNSEVDELTAQRDTALDPQEATDLNIQIDALLWEDLATLPLFAAPGILATDPRAQGVVYNPSQNGLTWNAQEWVLSTE